MLKIEIWKVVFSGFPCTTISNSFMTGEFVVSASSSRTMSLPYAFIHLYIRLDSTARFPICELQLRVYNTSCAILLSSRINGLVPIRLSIVCVTKSA